MRKISDFIRICTISISNIRVFMLCWIVGCFGKLPLKTTLNICGTFALKRFWIISNVNISLTVYHIMFLWFSRLVCSKFVWISMWHYVFIVRIQDSEINFEFSFGNFQKKGTCFSENRTHWVIYVHPKALNCAFY